MKAKVFLLAWLALFMLGCSTSDQKVKYQPKDEISRQTKYFLAEANRHLAAIRRQDRDSHLHVPDFNLMAEEGQLDLQRLGTTEEEIDSLVNESYRLSIKADLEDLRSLKLDGDYDGVVEHINFCVSQVDGNLQDYGTTAEELFDLVLQNKKALGRRIVAELRTADERGQLDQIDIPSYLDKIDALITELEVSPEIFGLTVEELTQFGLLDDEEFLPAEDGR